MDWVIQSRFRTERRSWARSWWLVDLLLFLLLLLFAGGIVVAGALGFLRVVCGAGEPFGRATHRRRHLVQPRVVKFRQFGDLRGVLRRQVRRLGGILCEVEQ